MVDGVAVADAVFGSQVLVLPIVILDRDIQPRSRVAELEERNVVAAATEAVSAPDLPQVEANDEPVREAVEKARDVARGCVILAAEAVGRRGEFALALRTWPFRQDTCVGRIAQAVRRTAVTDDVVVDVGYDIPSLRLGVISEDLGAV